MQIKGSKYIIFGTHHLLANMNAILQAHIPEHSRAATKNREAPNSDVGERRKDEVHESSRVEGVRERLGN
jgi:hypothetical protein